MFCSVLNTALMFGDSVSEPGADKSRLKLLSRLKAFLESWEKHSLCRPWRRERSAVIHHGLGGVCYCFLCGSDAGLWRFPEQAIPSGSVNGDLFLRWLWYVCVSSGSQRSWCYRTVSEGPFTLTAFYSNKPRFSFA